MSDKYSYTIIDGIKCYSPSISSSYSDYPHEGFDVTNENVNSSFWVKSRNRLFKYLIEKNTPSKETSFLEIGCGTGNFISTILENKNLTITGSEIYLNGLKYAQNNTPNVEFIQLDISEKALEQRFDIIAAFDVIEHIEDDCMAIININKMLAEEGIIIISVPQHMFMWSALDEIVKHKRRYSRSELINKLEKNGFEIQFSTSYVFVLFPLMLLSRIINKKRNNSNSDKLELEKRVKFSPFSNKVLNAFMKIDELLIELGISLPFGGTLVVVAKKIHEI